MTAAVARDPCDLIDIIDLKWLLVGDGHRVHVERLLGDDDYARRCLAWAAQSSNQATRATALRIAQRLGLVLPPPHQPS